ncbi:hypothetical protein Poli38472_009725 [Pythium oligandrum]|uniref:Methionyl-tRNA formyltransferase, mitochondrial n=1 Tax=Pythium oligandrum TaxID=41045 RepID=A0A8K1CHI0_PYTOL|nr:hypothetical protein Poli38472_009725 [Pythium oligandrum]|eukprot:TMW62232.1 hypothetical protein Poli38472_009725 [Pythium oligandrum]
MRFLTPVRVASIARRRSPWLVRGISATTKSAPYRVLFFGTDDVSVATLKRLYNNSQEADASKRLVQEIQVICPSDRKVGRSKRTDPVPVKRFALEHGLTVTHTPPNVKTLKSWDSEVLHAPFDVGVVVSFGYFLHPHLLANLRYGAINMHPSLLPKYRGPAPIHHALIHGDSVTGVSVIEIDPRAFDVGRILLQKPFDVPDGITSEPLAQQLAALGGDCVLEVLADLETRKEQAIVQSDAVASHAPKIKLQDGFLTLDETADQIFHRWQALSDNVGISVRYKEKDVKLVEMQRPTAEQLEQVRDEERRVCEQEANGNGSLTFPAGSFFFEKKLKALWLKCADESWLLLTKLQQADRKVGDALDFANGYRLKRSLERFDAIPREEE